MALNTALCRTVARNIWGRGTAVLDELDLARRSNAVAAPARELRAMLAQDVEAPDLDTVLARVLVDGVATLIR